MKNCILFFRLFSFGLFAGIPDTATAGGNSNGFDQYDRALVRSLGCPGRTPGGSTNLVFGLDAVGVELSDRQLDTEVIRILLDLKIQCLHQLQHLYVIA